MSEDKADKTQPWKGGFEPLDLPADLKGKVVMGSPPKEEVKSAIDMGFEAAYIGLKKSVESGDAEGYVKGIGKLTELMRTETQEHHAPPKFGDLHHTFMEWHREAPYLTETDRDTIKAGGDASKLSNTLDNQQRPHRDWPGGKTMSINSESFGNAVARYVNSRGNKFVTASVIPGLSDRNSEFIVKTIFKGFPKVVTSAV